MINIDPEFKSLIPPLSTEEYALLEANLIADGCRDPLVLWNNTIVDGHNRHEICTKYGLAFNTVAIEFEGKPQARIWMRANQIGRRNLSSVWSVDLALGNKADLAEIGAAKRFEARIGNQNAAKNGVINIDSAVSPKHSTQAEIAKAAGVSTGTVAMAEIVMREAPEIWEKAKAGELTISAAYKQVNEKKNGAHISNNSGNYEWYTPTRFIDAAREVMGSIDTDPASSEIANSSIKAAKIFTAAEDGRMQVWAGNVWMNPPYAQPLIGDFAEAISTKYETGEISQACILVNNATETVWFQRLLSAAGAVCFPKSRIKFIDTEGCASGSPLQGQAIVYMGLNVSAFNDVFSSEGRVLINA